MSFQGKIIININVIKLYVSGKRNCITNNFCNIFVNHDSSLSSVEKYFNRFRYV